MAKQTAAAKAAEHYGQLVDQSASYAYDPYGWVMYAFPWGSGDLEGETGPDDWQRDFLINLGNRVTDNACPEGGVIREATASGNGPGKSALVSWIILWSLSTFPNTKGVVTANTEHQLKTKTWAELARWHRACITKDLFELAATSIYWKAKEFEKTFRIDMAPWSLENTEAFQGLHNRGNRLICIYDEASGIDDPIWEVTEGSLTDKKTEIIWLVFGNPTKNTGRFRECFDGGDFAKRWVHRQIDTRTCRFSNKEQIAEWQEDYGEDSDFFKVRVRGEFPSKSANQFIPVSDVDRARRTTLNPNQYSFAPKILTCDPASTGDNELVIALRQGLHFEILRVMEKNDNDMLIGEILARIEDEEQCDAVFIDFGYGTGIHSYGKNLGRPWDLIKFGEVSPDPACVFMRDYMWNEMRKWLKDGGCIPEDKNLYWDLLAPESVPRADGKIKLESKDQVKKRLKKRSPDRADALALSFARGVVKKDRRGHYIQRYTDNSSPSYKSLGRGVQEQTERQTFREVSWRK